MAFLWDRYTRWEGERVADGGGLVGLVEVGIIEMQVLECVECLISSGRGKT